MKIESSKFEHGRVYFQQFGAERVNINYMYFYLRLGTNQMSSAYPDAQLYRQTGPSCAVEV